jgi:hypothetical protein
VGGDTARGSAAAGDPGAGLGVGGVVRAPSAAGADDGAGAVGDGGVDVEGDADLVVAASLLPGSCSGTVAGGAASAARGFGDEVGRGASAR